MSLTNPQAIRAIRYPERYGPRSADPALGGGQSRARGLGRAILDTFPIVKFGSSGDDRESSLPRPKDIESAPIDTESSVAVQLAQLSATAEHDEHHHDPQEGTVASAAGQEAREENQASEGTDQVDPSQIRTSDPGTSRVPASPREVDIRMPECIGRETCPICIVDFEEGDDLRVLPCEGKHRFHQSCVDPWLLELSGSCPICRQGNAKFGRFGNKKLTRSTHQIFMRWRRSFPESREARYLRPTVIAKEVHPQHRTGFLVTCDSRGYAREDLAVQCLRRRPNLECGFRRMYHTGISVSKLYWFNPGYTEWHVS